MPLIRFAAAFIILQFTALAAAAQETSYRVANWVATDETCTISAGFRNGKSLILAARPDGRLSLAIRSDYWELPEGYSKTVLYWTNEEDPQRGVARSIDRHTLQISVRDQAWIGVMLSDSYDATFAFGDKTHRFPITHGDKVRRWIANCSGINPSELATASGSPLAALSKAEGRSDGKPTWLNPANGGGGNASFGSKLGNLVPEFGAWNEPPRKKVRGSAALRFMLATLTEAGISGFEVDAITNSPHWAIRVNNVWTGDGRIGAIRRYSNMTSDLAYIEERRIHDHDKESCKGDFQKTPLESPVRAVSGFTIQCISGRSRWVRTRSYITAITPDNEAFTVMMEESGKDEVALAANAALLAEAAARTAASWTGQRAGS